jgi:MFS family permease
MRALLVLVGSIVFVDAMLFGALTPLVPGYADEFGLSKLEAGLLVGAFGAGALVGGIPAGLLAARFGARRAVLIGLVLLAAASFAFALAGEPWALGGARFVQGFSSALTWAGSFAWVTVLAPAERRGEVLGTLFGTAVFGAILGPMFGAVADIVEPRVAFAAVGVLGLALTVWASRSPQVQPELLRPGSLRRAFRSRRFVVGLWLMTLPAALFGVLIVLAPLSLDAHGYGPLAIGVVFLAAGVFEVVLNPVLGRLSDRVGRLLPIRISLLASALVAALLAAAGTPWTVVALVAAAALAFGSFYTPGMALTSDTAESVGLSHAMSFGLMNATWAVGNLAGPSVGGALAGAFGDGVPYLTCAGLCLLTLALLETSLRRDL